MERKIVYMKTIKNLKLTNRQWELLRNAVLYYETIIEDYISDNVVGFSHKTIESINDMYHRLDLG